MKIVEGKYNTCEVFTDNLEQSCESQLKLFMDQESIEGSKVRVMPDCHSGKGCVIGTTMTIKDKVIPNVVGVDISCGISVTQLQEKRLNLPELDSFIIKNIPVGQCIRERPHRSHGRIHIEDLKCYKKLDIRRAVQALGTLGGGNHFISVEKDEDDNLYLIIHTGSRNLGKKVAEYYQDQAYKLLGGKGQEIPHELAYLTGDMFEQYIEDMKLMEKYAALNRQIIKEVIMDGLNLHEVDSFESVHNYIDVDNMILRKGSVSAQKGERLIIPLNMRDGSLICVGKGNPDWNYSAPHGAGRVLSRADAKNSISMSDYKESMEGIYTTCITPETVDESPFAYKPMEEILDNIEDTVTVEKKLHPVYNFKASEKWGKRRR